MCHRTQVQEYSQASGKAWKNHQAPRDTLIWPLVSAWTSVSFSFLEDWPSLHLNSQDRRKRLFTAPNSYVQKTSPHWRRVSLSVSVPIGERIWFTESELGICHFSKKLQPRDQDYEVQTLRGLLVGMTGQFKWSLQMERSLLCLPDLGIKEVNAP